METKNNIHLIPNHWGMMKHLKRETKLDLILMLTESLKDNSEASMVCASDFYGTWGDDGMDTDEYLSQHLNN